MTDKFVEKLHLSADGHVEISEMDQANANITQGRDKCSGVQTLDKLLAR